MVFECSLCGFADVAKSLFALWQTLTVTRRLGKVPGTARHSTSFPASCYAVVSLHMSKMCHCVMWGRVF